MPENPILFVSAPATTDTTALRSVLKKLGASVTDAFDFKPSDSLSDSIIAKISKSDGVIIVYSENSSAAAFEAGASAALKKPVLVLIDPKCAIPAFIQSFLYLKSTFKDTPVLQASLSRFVQDVTSRRSRPKIRPKRKQQQSVERTQTSSYVDKIRQWRENPSPLEAEKLVERILKDAGLQVESSSGAYDISLERGWIEIAFHGSRGKTGHHRENLRCPKAWKTSSRRPCESQGSPCDNLQTNSCVTCGVTSAAARPH